MAVHVVYMSAKKVTPIPKEPLYQRTQMRQWREKRQMTLEEAGEAIGLSHAQLGRIERGVQPYNQGLLEALAELYATDVRSLIARDPNDPDGFWALWDRAKPHQKQMLAQIAETVLKTGTEG